MADLSKDLPSEKYIEQLRQQHFHFWRAVEVTNTLARRL
jgi:hypothetical protein